jgi:hypothetical protein
MLETIRNSTSLNLQDADSLSQDLAKILVFETSSVVGNKRPTHEKSKHCTLEAKKIQAEISTIENARNLIRTLWLKETSSPDEESEVKTHLSVLLDRLCRMGLNSVPRDLTLASLHEWSEVDALSDWLRYDASRKYRNPLSLKSIKIVSVRCFWIQRNEVFGLRKSMADSQVVAQILQ